MELNLVCSRTAMIEQQEYQHEIYCALIYVHDIAYPQAIYRF